MCLLKNEPTSLFYTAWLISVWKGVIVKARVNSPSSIYLESRMNKTRSRVIYPWPGWSSEKSGWRTEPTSRSTLGDELWIAEKFQSNSAIAGSPRNSFRASVRCWLLGVEHWMRLEPQGIRLNQTPNTSRCNLAVRLWGLSSISQKGNSPDRSLRSQNLC